MQLHMKRRVLLIVSVIYFPGMVAVDSWLFQTALGMSYVDWYIANGSLISVTASLFTVVWKNLNDNPGLIAADPRGFLAANMLLVGVQLQVIGHHLEDTGTRFRSHGASVSDLLDGVAGMVTALVMFVAMLAWVVAVVPLQYFIVVVAGAPARLALKLQAQGSPAGDRGGETPGGNDWKLWERNLLSAPVSMTNAVAALVILAIKLVRAA